MITVIVPTSNEEKTVGRCLTALRKQNAQIIVADGGSNDNTVKIAEKYTDKILFDDGDGPGVARNLGVKYAGNPVVAFTDADTVVAPNWVETIEVRFKDKSLLGLGGIIRPLGGSLHDKIIFKWNSDLWYRFSALFGFYQFSGNNSAYLKSAFQKAGGFNESLSFLEDTDLSLRVSKIGKVMVDKDMVVYSSIRRFKQKGYLSTGLRFANAYLLYFRKKPLNDGYFKDISKL